MPVLDDYFKRLVSGPPFADGEEMQFEMVRLHSFLGWPMYAPVQPTQLALAGFYYTGVETRVKCFRCFGIIEQWSESDSAMRKHEEMYPACPIVTGRDTLNVPIVLNPAYALPEWPSDIPINADLLHNEVANLRQFMQNLDTCGWILSRLPAQNNVGSFAMPQSLSMAQNALDTLSPPGAQAASISPGINDMKKECNRLLTYTDWPFSAPIKPSELASAGFYYTHIADRVECAFCHGILRDWEVGDLAMEEHRRHFSACPFINGDDVGNVPEASTVSVQKQSSMQQIRKVPQDQSLVNRMGSLQLDNKWSAGISQSSQVVGEHIPESLTEHGCLLGEFATEAARQASFSSPWPTHLHQTVETLAQAGFYYVGPRDNVKCFQCAGSLRSWEPNDDPWTEHARWFPNCRFVREKKGDEFIRRATQVNPIQMPPSPLPQAAAPPRAAAASAVEYRVEAREIKARLDSPMSQTVIRMGYDPYLVSKTIEKRLKDTGDDFTDVETFVEALLEMEPELAQQGLVTRRPVEPRSSPSVLPLTQNITNLAMPQHGQPFQTGRVLHVGEGSTTPVGLAGATGSTEHEELAAAGVTKAPTPTQTKGKKKKPKKKKAQGTEGGTPAGNEAAAAVNSAGSGAAQTVEESKSLSEEIRQLKEARTCKICMDAELNVVFLPCGHMVCCQGCAPALRTCPICRTVIRGTVKTFLA